MLRLVLFTVVMFLVPVSSYGNGLSVQSFTKDSAKQQATQTIGGEYARQNAPAAGQNTASAYKDKLLATSQEYRGYNGRTLEQSFYRCKFESYRSAPPGDMNRGIFEKMRIRMYIMDTCMNSEGFFRTQRSYGLDFDYLTSADFIVPSK